MSQRQPSPLNVDDLFVDSFETSALSPISPLTTLNDPTAATRCYYCPPASFDRACIDTIAAL